MADRPKRYQQFIDDMEGAGIEWEEYQGRFFYNGPAARTNEDGWPTMQDVHHATNVKVQRDNLAFNWIIYPA